MIDPEILTESHTERMDLIRKLGIRDLEDVEYRLRLLVNQCLDDIKAIRRDLPAYKRYESSNESAAIKIPSQRLRDIEREFDELIKWFEGGRRPRLRNYVSGYAIDAMLGNPPFGRHFIVLSRHDTQPMLTADRPSDRQVTRKKVHFFDVLSSDRSIAACQIDLYSNLRTAENEPLLLEVIPIEINWPAALERVAQRRDQRIGHVQIGELEAAFSRDDFLVMAEEAKKTRAIVHFMRDNSDQRSKASVGRWARCEPAFELVSAMLDEVWPLTKGHPQANRLGAKRAKGSRSDRQLLRELVQNLADLVQEKINADHDFRSERFDDVRAPNHFLGKITYDNQLEDLFNLILGLRQEFVAYSVARHTIAEIVEAAVRQGKDEISTAANRVSEFIIVKIDGRIAARRIFLNFGADHLQGNAVKWCGRLDPNMRQHWNGAAELIGMAYPTADLDQDHHLGLCDDLVRALEPDNETSPAWEDLRAWAQNEGRRFWRVAIPEIDERGSFSIGEFFLG